MSTRTDRCAIVLSAGGVRGAYQVGVIDAMVDLLGRRGAAGPPLFNSFSGSSIGAINTAYLAANADRADHAIDGLVRLWKNLDVSQSLRFSPSSLLWGYPRLRLPGCRGREKFPISGYVGRSLFDPRPVEALLEQEIDWDRLHANVRNAIVDAVVIGAHDIQEGRATLFAELAEGVKLRAYPEPARTELEPVTLERVLASTALPFMFPAQGIGGRYYMDSGLSLATPVLPALRVDADRVVVISLHEQHRPGREGKLEYPSFIYLLGQICAALLLDPDLSSLNTLLQTNRAFEAVAETIDPPTMAEVIEKFEEHQILPHRPIPTLVFRPSENIALLTSEFMREELASGRLSLLWRVLLRNAGCEEAGHQALLASILFLDGRLAERLIELGRRDAYAASEEILEFFGG
ncbi:patatin-like phospholipase family protein [Enhygromyxa salina]|uniref:Patatin-like phospholipase n=1 Tax=Enhygromyxa salina TaxID=215803 RepID=A0A2S9YP91_9BACT|nr:patatin-like phospholipase family protein [Enhygromyxa salina]PRQ06898.1 Patatin-like phospholipase [Enhygromyxa salina]